ncbi:MAG: DUF4157 domain-containing protein [Crocinitomicaceae bacterium]
MKELDDKVNESQKENIQRVSMEQSNGGTSQLVDNRAESTVQRKLQETMNTSSGNGGNPIQRKNNTGLPDNLKSGIENLSGHSMDDVKVHYNSNKPAQLQAHAYAQGTDIHLGSGQEKHLAHEAWHVVQQKQGRVKPTKQLKSKVAINDNAGLEREADVMGQRASQAHGGRVQSSIAKNRTSQIPKEGRSEVLQRVVIGGANVPVDRAMIDAQIAVVNGRITNRFLAASPATRTALEKSVEKMEILLANWQLDDYRAYRNAMKEGLVFSGRQRGGGLRKWTGNPWKSMESIINSFVIDSNGLSNVARTAREVLDAVRPALDSIARRYIVKNASTYGENFARLRNIEINKGMKGANSKEFQAMCRDFQLHAKRIIRRFNRHIRVEEVGSLSIQHNWLVVGRERTDVNGTIIPIDQLQNWGNDCFTVDLWEGAREWGGRLPANDNDPTAPAPTIEYDTFYRDDDPDPDVINYNRCITSHIDV